MMSCSIRTGTPAPSPGKSCVRVVGFSVGTTWATFREARFTGLGQRIDLGVLLGDI